MPATITAPRTQPRASAAPRCFACGGRGLTLFYQVRGVPARSVVLLDSRDDALAYPRGDIDLAFCDDCGFVQNMSFDAALVDYRRPEEETQTFSPTFRAFAEDLVDGYVSRYDLAGRHVLEIGCGKGEFLSLICARAGATGLGIDPAWEPGRLDASDDVTFERDYYSFRHRDLTADLVLCRHTLEHIQPVAEFLRLVRRNAAVRGAPVSVEVPDVGRVLREGAFWDVYYEHCSYFTLGSLARLFAAEGFALRHASVGYGDQYLVMDAIPGDRRAAPHPCFGDLDTLRAGVEAFAERAPAAVAAWRQLLVDAHRSGERVVVWGGGSKAVAFLTTLGISDEVSAVVDINPHKHGRFLPGTGHEVRSPETLADEGPDLVVVMNPVYTDEVASSLRDLGVTAEIVTV